MGKEVKKVERNAIAEFEITPEKVALMAKGYMVMTVPEADNKAYAEVRAALTTCVKTRTGVDKRRKDLGSDARKWVSEVNDAAKQLIGPLAPVEEHLKSELTREDTRKDAIKEVEAQKEADRVAGIREKISSISQIVTSLNSLNSVALEKIIAEIDAIELPIDEYQELIAEANLTKHNASVAAHEALEARVKLEKEEADRKALAERLAKQKAEQDAEAARQKEEREAIESGQREQERIQREAREKFETEQLKAEVKTRVAREALEAEKAAFEKAKQDEIDRQDREKREAEEAEAAKIKAGKDAKEKVEREEAAMVAKEKAEADRIARIEELKPDKEKLSAWSDLLHEITGPDLKTAGADEIRNQVLIKLGSVIDFLDRSIKEHLS